MQRAEQVAIGQRLFDYIDHRTTAMADTVYRQPVREYTCPEIAAEEQRRFFRQRPLCVGMSGLLPEPGAYYTHDLSGLPLLLARAEDGEVRALLNVCRHRGARVAADCGKGRAFVCPYHAWTYGLDGRLVQRPADESFTAAPRERHGLTQLTAIERDGLIWVSPAAGRVFSLDQHLAGLSGELAAFDLAGFHHYESRVLTRRMNWKLMLDTFLESYHFCVLHKDSICSVFYENLSTFDTWGPHFRLVGARRTIEDMRRVPVSNWNLMPHMVAIYVFFPNTVLVWQLDHIELWQIFPGEDAPEESRVLLSLYTPEPAITDSARRHWDNNLDLVVHVVENEDFPVGEGVQRGFHSGAQQHIVFGRNEPALAHFHRTVTAGIGAEKLPG
jgi:phenylpropionate dioxygenase-like ring-hydroxylating dioxygenase large terminal subunit